MSLDNDDFFTGRLIKSVTYQLPGDITFVKKVPPFRLTKVSVSTHWIKVSICFQPWAKESIMVIWHELKFKVGGKVSEIKLKDPIDDGVTDRD